MTEDTLEGDKEWSARIAAVVVATLNLAGIVADSDHERAEAITREEILVRLVIGDRPPYAPSGPPERKAPP